MKRTLFIVLVICLLLAGCAGAKGNTTLKYEPLSEDSFQERAIATRGSTERIRNILDRAAKGDSLTIGFIGGSITEGYGVSDRSKCYASLVSSWFEESFPDAEFTFVNAGVAGTGSEYACQRLDEDLLKYEPDFVFVEFSVNDDGSFTTKKYFDELLTRIEDSEKKPAILVLNMVIYDNGYNAESMHNVVAFAHDIPALSMKQSLYEDVLAGIYKPEELADDYVHPNERGYSLINEIITYYLTKVYYEGFSEENNE